MMVFDGLFMNNPSMYNRTAVGETGVESPEVVEAGVVLFVCLFFVLSFLILVPQAPQNSSVL